MIDIDRLTTGPDGLVVTVVQDSTTGEVLMVGYSNAESLRATTSTGLLHFWSRSRNELWKKGKTSGSTLTVESIRADCDADALLVEVAPAGPVCHTGAQSCFGDTDRVGLGQAIEQLVGIIDRRRIERTEGSYTVTLLDDADLAARKVLEEAGEVAFAAKDRVHDNGGSSESVTAEAADLIYHLLVMLAGADVAPSEVGRELRRRMG